MTTEEILSSNLNKTEKIKRLLALNYTRKYVAQLVGTNYGMVQNVYAKMYPEKIRRRNLREIIEESNWDLSSFIFNHRFGVEIEAFGVDRAELKTELVEVGIGTEVDYRSHTINGNWKVVQDSSIRGSKPFELVSPILEGEQGLRKLKTVTHILKGMETRVNKSCGVHVHLSADGFDLDTWKRLYKNYAKIEKIIDSFMPQSRRANRNSSYCQSMRVDNFESKIDRARNLEEIERAITNRNRYYKLNTQCFWTKRSVEFRQHSATINYKKISNWIIFLARLVEFSKHKVVSGESWEALKEFLPNEQIEYFKQRARELA
jgi:hypothetical protein